MLLMEIRVLGCGSDRFLHLIELHIDAAEQHHRGREHQCPGKPIDQQSFRRPIGVLCFPSAQPLPDDDTGCLRQPAQRTDHNTLYGIRQGHRGAGIGADVSVDRSIDVLPKLHMASQTSSGSSRDKYCLQ